MCRHSIRPSFQSCLILLDYFTFSQIFFVQDCLSKQIFSQKFWLFCVTSKHFSIFNNDINRTSCVKVSNIRILCKGYFAYLIQQELIQVIFHINNRYWVPKFSCQNSEKKSEKKILTFKKEIRKRRKKNNSVIHTLLIYCDPLKYNLVQNFLYSLYWLSVFFQKSKNTVTVSFSVK